ncbi:hypothetical protein UFOVP1223_12 [uncultured Caudovirales phage]|uniref:Bacteriophage lambda, GpH, tail tape measure, C-terminal n=3 Tax=uncultured Caudovirales phage TaxID=2100421 RepID=A0A6J5MMI6_9CAUD|nr:hypothetical protein UFOVP494_3 [uncultured Caudovirales phage]CAB4191169.1 hypothetical protein UFOVP1223_12 [uncultured Caudovirales phage]
MAITIPVITEFSDKGLKSAKAAFANFKTDVSNATGAMGKFKAGSNAALGAVKANSGALALAGGAAIAGFAVKAIGAFQDLALASGKFADATGLSVEEASRFIEVGGDIGIEAGTIESAIGKMNKTLGATPEVFKQLGVDVVRTDSGLTDVNGTFLAVIDRLNEIKDPAQRATVAAQLLGKGWQSMAELINLGSDEIQKSLDSVAGAQVISEKELARAKEYRETVDSLSDLWAGFTIEAGNALVAVTNDFKQGTSGWEGFKKSVSDGAIGSAISKLSGLFNDNEEDAKATATEAKRLGDAYGGYVASRLADSRQQFALLNGELEDQEDGLSTLTKEWQILLDTLDTTEAFDNLETSLGAVYEAGIKAFGGGADEVAKYEQEVRDHIRAIADLATALDLTFGEQNKLKIFVDTGDLAAADEYLARISRGFGVDLGFGVGIEGARASGGSVMGGGSYLVGERGPEIFTPASSGMITPNSAIGGNTITINVQGADPQAVVRALQDYNRTAGPIPVNTRAN